MNETEMAKADAAARLRGLPRAHYVRRVVLEAAERDLRAAVETGEQAGE